MSDLMVSAAEVDHRIIPPEDFVADYGAPAEVQFPDSAHKRRRQQLLVVERVGHLSAIERPVKGRGARVAPIDEVNVYVRCGTESSSARRLHGWRGHHDPGKKHDAWACGPAWRNSDAESVAQGGANK